MKNKICSECGSDLSNPKLSAKLHNIPFKCKKCGNIEFKFKPVNGCTFIYPIYQYVKTSVSSSILEIPDFVAKRYKTDYGIVLAISDSFVSKKGKFIQNFGIEVGDKICYDKSVPWGDSYRGADGIFYNVVLCNLVDLWAKCVDE